MAPIEVVRDSVSLGRLREIVVQQFGEFVKAVVDVERRIMAIGGELHADEEAELLELGSQQAHLWGINLYPEQYPRDKWLEFDSMINLKPSQGNRSRSVEDPEQRQIVRAVVDELVDDD